MKFTLSWLKKHLHTSAAITEICNKLTDIGLEVEEYEKDENNQDKFLRIATIKSTKPHPNADKLQICQVEVDQAGSLLQIICGASNARANLKTIYAPIGATIPENKLKIKKSQIRGVESFGMLCSESELGLSENSEGIIEISKDFTNGTNIDKIFQKQHLIDVNITPNRGDCLGVFGIARDLAATNIGSLINLPKINFKQEGKSLNIELNSNKCQYITLRNISNLQNNQSPIWLKNILEKIGISSYNAIVDITNYVMFTTGHPVHIYDSDNISGNKITISEAKDGDAIISLKDQKLEFKKGDIIALDNKNIIALSGIIGEKNSSISNQTKNIIIEAAIFDKNQIAQTSRRLKIETDSKYRFERGVDLEMIDYAVDLTASMIQEICQGVISERSFSGNKSKNIKSINFELTEIKKLLAIDISKSEIIAILEKLSFMVGDKDKEILQITPPSFRNDIKIKNDIIEEIARIYGFNKIEPKKPENLQINRNHPNWQELLSKKLVNNGFNETINWSFIKKDDLKIFSAIDEDLKISNPINIDMEYMRNSLLPSLIKNIKFNISKGHEKLSLFEIGNIFDSTNFSKRKDIICAARSGFNKDKNIHNKRRQFDILDLKEDLLDCLEIFFNI